MKEWNKPQLTELGTNMTQKGGGGHGGGGGGHGGGGDHGGGGGCPPGPIDS